jgi:hypothetical protein
VHIILVLPKGGRRLSSNKIVKSVSFNITNEQDQAYLARIQNVQFATYVKRLIDKDIKSRRVIKAEQAPAKSLSDGPVIIRTV